MSYIVVKIINGKAYRYQYRCSRVDGKPKSIYEAYLGSTIVPVMPVKEPVLGSTKRRWWGRLFKRKGGR